VEARGLFYPPDPNSADICSIGGNVACNAGGPRALKYGVTRNYVLGLEVVLPTGQVLNVGKQTLKHVTGYDLTGLIVGSEGTLGVVTKAVLRLLPYPPAVETALVLFQDVHVAARVLTKLMAEGHQPRTLELLDHHALDAVRKKSPGQLPEGAGALVILETDGPDAERAFGDLGRMAERCLAEGALDVQVAQDAAERKRIWAPRNILSESLRETAEAKVSEDIVVPRSKIPAMVEAAERIARETGVRVATYGHAGDGNLHVNVLFARDDRPAAEQAVSAVIRAAVELGGTLSGEHGVGLTKRDFLPLEHPPEKIALQRALKHTLDPNGILNPGKVLPPEGSPLS
jgi:glycolate oxidase